MYIYMCISVNVCMCGWSYVIYTHTSVHIYDDMRLAYTAAITSILPNIIVGIDKIEFSPSGLNGLAQRTQANR